MEIQSHSSADSLTMMNGFWLLANQKAFKTCTYQPITFAPLFDECPTTWKTVFSFQYQLSLKTAYCVIHSFRKKSFSRHYGLFWSFSFWKSLWSIVVGFHSHQGLFLAPSTTDNDPAHTYRILSESIIEHYFFPFLVFPISISLSTTTPPPPPIFLLSKFLSIDLMLVWPILRFS